MHETVAGEYRVHPWDEHVCVRPGDAQERHRDVRVLRVRPKDTHAHPEDVRDGRQGVRDVHPRNHRVHC